jgi:hypothetical protein
MNLLPSHPAGVEVLSSSLRMVAAEAKAVLRASVLSSLFPLFINLWHDPATRGAKLTRRDTSKCPVFKLNNCIVVRVGPWQRCIRPILRRNPILLPVI